VSPDGRRAAATPFSNGHSYAERGFATTTTVFDLESGTVAVPNLERFSVQRGRWRHTSEPLVLADAYSPAVLRTTQVVMQR